MAEKSAKMCKESDDFVTSYEKWESASKRWKNHWFETCVEIFQKSKKWAKEFVIDMVERVITRVVKKVTHRRKLTSPDMIEWNCEKIDYPAKTELFYLIRAMDENGQLIFSKVGTTTRNVEQRMKEHLRYYHDIGVRKILIDRVYSNSDIPAEELESTFRALYIARYPDKFKKNDRFFDVVFDFAEADKIYHEKTGTALA